MSQKDKVKELVGRGLNSYHTKALQQIERIEKKNKEQNHKISILTGELDKDYITKTAEGSVISLDHSKEGMVYLDELQGNTLVNYCTDGSKELTLNGDIDAEGTFVTTTEGVDNGKVDVMCEGNTLVNLSDYKSLSFTKTGEESGYKFKEVACPLVKTNTTYTVFVNITKNQNTVDRKVGFAFIHNGGLASNEQVFNSDTGFKCFTLTTRNMDVPKGINFRFFCSHGGSLGEFACDNLVILEGDWTNKEIPSYFEGMKSVGQDDTNGHKIEILSQNKNLFNYEEYYRFFPSTKTSDNTILSHKGDLKGGNHNFGFASPMKVNLKPNTTYTFCVFNLSDSGQVLSCEGCLSSRSAELGMNIPIGEVGYKVFTTNSTNYKDGISFKFNTSTDGDNAKYKIMLVEGDTRPTNYIHFTQNKKEILINEPLRKGNTEVKDRIIKLNNKWYIERNYEEIILDGSYTWKINGNGTIYYATTIFGGNKYVLPTLNSKMCNMVCDKRIVTHIDYIYAKEPNSIVGYIGITKDGNLGMSLDNKTPEQIKAELTSNPIRIILQLKTPTYEPLEVEPTLLTYNEVTHISNNSIIPCNMKIQNTGYNAIIKPNTLYTVAVDTNKTGTVGINLGGAKVTTTNNVAKITTPATLTDDSLRLYGKGIKGSKVRLLEGDKTNWIPSHFEGMKSSFEDKLQEDNSYKMEISMNNRNLFSVKDISFKRAGESSKIDIFTDELIQYTTTAPCYTQGFMVLKLEPFTTYRLSAELQLIQIHLFYGKVGGWDANKYFGDIHNLTGTSLTLKSKEFTTDKSGIVTVRVTNEQRVGTNIAKNIMIQKVNNTNYIHQESNKIQFSSIEPLRKWDRFVLKDSQLMIERGSATITFNGSESWSFNNTDGTTTNRYFLPNAFLGGTEGQNTNNTLCDKLVVHSWSQTAILGIARNESSAFIYNKYITNTGNFKRWLSENNLHITYRLKEPTYEEIPYELQKIILEGYENGTLFIDTNIPPTSVVTYAGETPIVKATKINKTEVSNNTADINDNILPYLMDMDYRIVMLQLATEELEGEVSMARLFGETYEMLKRDILSKRLSRQEYGYRLADYFNAGKLTEEQVRELEELR